MTACSAEEADSAEEAGEASDTAVRCCMCGEPVTDGPHALCALPCGHYYGRSCAERLFDGATVGAPAPPPAPPQPLERIRRRRCAGGCDGVFDQTDVRVVFLSPALLEPSTRHRRLASRIRRVEQRKRTLALRARGAREHNVLNPVARARRRLSLVGDAATRLAVAAAARGAAAARAVARGAEPPPQLPQLPTADAAVANLGLRMERDVARRVRVALPEAWRAEGFASIAAAAVASTTTPSVYAYLHAGKRNGEQRQQQPQAVGAAPAAAASLRPSAAVGVVCLTAEAAVGVACLTVGGVGGDGDGDSRQRPLHPLFVAPCRGGGPSTAASRCLLCVVGFTQKEEFHVAVYPSPLLLSSASAAAVPVAAVSSTPFDAASHGVPSALACCERGGGMVARVGTASGRVVDVTQVVAQQSRGLSLLPPGVRVFRENGCVGRVDAVNAAAVAGASGVGRVGDGDGDGDGDGGVLEQALGTASGFNGCVAAGLDRSVALRCTHPALPSVQTVLVYSVGAASSSLLASLPLFAPPPTRAPPAVALHDFAAPSGATAYAVLLAGHLHVSTTADPGRVGVLNARPMVPLAFAWVPAPDSTGEQGEPALAVLSPGQLTVYLCSPQVESEEDGGDDDDGSVVEIE